MEINSYTPYIPSTNNSSLTQSKLEKAYTEKDDKELREACQEFEATFINMLFKEMRKTVGSSDSNFALDTVISALSTNIYNSFHNKKPEAKTSPRVLYTFLQSGALHPCTACSAGDNIDSACALFEFDSTVAESEQSEIAAAADIFTGKYQF